jgi:hypothetical protein
MGLSALIRRYPREFTNRIIIFAKFCAKHFEGNRQSNGYRHSPIQLCYYHIFFFPSPSYPVSSMMLFMFARATFSKPNGCLPKSPKLNLAPQIFGTREWLVDKSTSFPYCAAYPNARDA